MNVVVSILFLILAVTGQHVWPNGKPELFSKVERVFREVEPAWKLERVTPGHTADPLSQDFVYRSKSGQAAIGISIWRRDEDARDVFAGQSIAFDDIANGKPVKRRIAGLGDENYIWTTRKDSAWPTIRFRKGRIVAMVFAPDVATAKRFAGHVLKQITAGQPSTGSQN
jgi:hypothetical protein